MSIGGDDQPRVALARQPGVGVVEIEPIDLAVDFERHAVARRSGRHAIHVDPDRFPLQQQAPRGMAEDVHPRRFQRPEHAIGHLRGVLAEMGMHGYHDQIELREAVVCQVEAAVRQDVALDAGEQRQAVEPAVQRAHPAGVLQRAVLVEPIGHPQRLAVIRDGHVAVTEAVRAGRHRFKIVAAVGGRGVHVQVAPEIRG